MAGPSFSADGLASLLTSEPAEADLPDLDELPHLPMGLRDQVLDRIEAGYRAGLFRLTLDDYAGLLVCLCPDEFEIPPADASPTTTPPKSNARVEAYMVRCRDELAIFHALDAAADARHGLKPHWPGQADPRAVAWIEETHRERPSGKPRRKRNRDQMG